MKKSKAAVILIVILAALAGLAYYASIILSSTGIGETMSIPLGLDLSGGVSITYEVMDENPSAEDMSDTIYKLQKRVEGYSTEASVYQVGDDRITVEIPGVSDANTILEELGNPGSLEFQYSDGTVYMTGDQVADAQAGTVQNEYGSKEYVVSLTLTDEGAEIFAEATSNNVGGYLPIIYDGEIISYPQVKQAITGGAAQISGMKTYEEADMLATQIRIGSLSLELQELESSVVGAQLGSQAISSSLKAAAIGLVIVMVFMIVMYAVPGVAASIALAIYTGLVIATLYLFEITLTLPGIAGIILGIGMAVDANVIVFTRISEELGTGKTVRSSIKKGFEKALSAIIDGNVTTLIAAAVLYFLGSGTIKGFAQTLAIGIILSMGTALFVTKFILNALYNAGFEQEKFYGIKKEGKTFSFTKHSMKYLIVFGVVIVLLVVSLVIGKSRTGNSLNYGLDFMGGTSTEIVFEGSAPSNQELEGLVQDTLGKSGEVVQIQGEEAAIIKTEVLSLEEKTKLEAALHEKYGVSGEDITSTSISGTVSGEMKSDAVVAVVVATICMMLYIWIRFKNLGFAASSVLALCHDVLFVLMIYAVSRISVGNAFIACMLTLVGYSINATIVVFDRIRENMKEKLKKDSLEDVVNASISQTISRSINTSLTTFVMVLTLSIFGVSSIREFSIPLMAGIVCGAYSSVFLAGTLWYHINKFREKRNTEQ